MQDTYKQRIKGFLIFTAMGLLVFGIFYGAYHGPWDQNFNKEMNNRKRLYERPKLPAVQKDRIILGLDQPVRFGKNRYVFNGLKDDQILIAVYILDLDPEVAYHHAIPVKEARKGLRLAGQNFRLITYRPKMLVLGF